jgi:hypothetical protein
VTPDPRIEAYLSAERVVLNTRRSLTILLSPSNLSEADCLLAKSIQSAEVFVGPDTPKSVVA